MKTTANKILVTIIEEEAKKNDLGLTLPSALEMEGIEKAKVYFVGKEITTEWMPDDTVYIYKGAGTKVTSPEGKTYRVISVTDIIVILWVVKKLSLVIPEW